MKKCPNCNQIFKDDDIFCVNDGTTLIGIQDVNQSGIVVSWEDNSSSEVPTQIVSRPAQPADTSQNNSKYLYAIIGALVAIILALGVGFFTLRNTNVQETAQNANQSENSTNENNSVDSFLSNQNTAQPVNIPADNAEKPIVNSNLEIRSSENTWSDNRRLVANSARSDNRRPVTSSAKSDFSFTRSFTRTFSGTAADDRISMKLQRRGPSLGGRVFSRKSVTDINVSGRIYDDGTFEMNEYSDIGAITGVYQGRINPDGTMIGTWTKPDGSKPRPVSLRAN